MIGNTFVYQSTDTYSTSNSTMLGVSIASIANWPFHGYIKQVRGLVMIQWSRRTTIQLTVILVGLFYSCAAFELDLGETGDSFGDVYDTYVHSTPVQSPKPATGIHRHNLQTQTVLAAPKIPLTLSVDWLLVLTLPALSFYYYLPPTRRRLQVLHAIWRI